MFYGRGYKDCVMYTAFILNNMGYRVVVNDLSIDREMADIISHTEFGCPMRTYRNIDFNFSGEIIRGYDFNLSYISCCGGSEKEMNWNYLIINSSAYKTDLYNCEKIIDTYVSDTIFILRDKLGSINKKYISKYMLSERKILCMLEVKYDEYDKEYQYSMDYDGIVQFKYLSDDFCKALVKCACVITGKGQEEVKKALKWAKGGKVFDNRFLE